MIAEGAVGSCCCDVSWATSLHGNAAAKTRINQNLIRSFIIAVGASCEGVSQDRFSDSPYKYSGPYPGTPFDGLS